MPDFKNRSYTKELLDGDAIPFEDIKRNMQELDFINTYLGGHKITLDGLNYFVKKFFSKKTWTIAEIGCGGGDNLKAIYKWCAKKSIRVNLIGIDINAECIAYAKENCESIQTINFITSDYKKVIFETQPDIIFSSLFCHHFNEDELLEMFAWLKQNAGIGFFINDLQRHWLAHYSIKILTQLFSKSYLVKNDAPLSVLRGFKKRELEVLLNQSGLKNYSVQWKWAFRYLVVATNSSGGGS